MKKLFFWVGGIGVSPWLFAVPTQVPTIYVSKSRQEKTGTSVPFNYEDAWMTRHIIQQKAYSSLSQVLQSMTGIANQDLLGDGSHVMYSLRGFGSNASANQLVLLNGVPLSNPDLSVLSLNRLPLASLSHLRLSTQSEGVRYGDQAVAGTIAVDTMQSFDKPETQLSIETGSYAKKHTAIFHAGSISSHLGYWGYLGRSLDDHYRVHNHQKTNDALLNLHYADEKNQANLLAEYTINDLQLPGALNEHQLKQDRRQSQFGSADPDVEMDYHRFLQGIWQATLSSHWQTQLSLMLRDMHGGGFEYPEIFSKRRRVFFESPVLHGQFFLKDNLLDLEVGLQAQQASYDLLGQNYFNKAKQSKSALFFETSWLFKPGWRLSLGERVAQIQARVRTQLPIKRAQLNRAHINQLSLERTLSSRLTAFIARRESYRFPLVDEMALTGNNSALKTQLGVSYAMGLIWHRDLSQIKAEIYQLDLRREIEYLPNINAYFGTNRNLAPTRRRGFFLQGQHYFSLHWLASANFRYVEPRFSSGPYAYKQIPLVSKETMNLRLDYHLNDTFSAGLEGFFVGKHFSASDDNNQGKCIGGVTFYNASLAYHLLDKFRLTLQVNNLLNKAYYSYTQALENNQGSIDTYYYPAPVRNWALQLSFLF